MPSYFRTTPAFRVRRRYILSKTAGTTYFQTVSGAITPSGDILKQTNKTLAGNISTIAGTLAKQINKILSGSISTITGSILKQTNLTFEGDISSIVGNLIKQTNKVLSGTLSSSGVLTAVKTALKDLSGEITPSGNLTKQTNKSLSGSISSIVGTLSREVRKVLTGDLTSSGSITKQTNKILSGTLTTSGTLTAIKTALKSLEGTLTSAGSLIKSTLTSKAGSIGSSGNISKQAGKSLSGTEGLSGTLTKLVSKILSGQITPSGTLQAVSIFLKSLAGSLGFSGSIAKQTNKQVSGQLSESGTLSKFISKLISGNVTPQGSISKNISKFFSGVLSSSGILTTLTGIVQAAISRVYLLGSQAYKITLEGVSKRTQLFYGIYDTLVSLLGSVHRDFTAPNIQVPVTYHLNFDGVNDKIVISPSSSLNNLPLMSFTVEASVQLNKKDGSLINKMEALYSLGWDIFVWTDISGNAYVEFLIYGNGGNSWVTRTWVVSDEELHHYEFSYDSGSQTMRLFIDGVLQTPFDSSFEGSLTPYNDSSYGVGLGHYAHWLPSDTQWWLSGAIYWIIVSNIVKHTSNFIAPNLRTAPNAVASTVLRLDLDAGSGTLAADTSNNGNHGTITGATWEQD